MVRPGVEWLVVCEARISKPVDGAAMLQVFAGEVEHGYANAAVAGDHGR